MSTFKRLAPKLLLAVVSPILFLFVVEMLLRLFTSGAIYINEANPHFRGEDGIVRLMPNQSVWWYGCRYDINSDGFRMDREVDHGRPVKVLGMGDSITLGMGVTKTRDVWPNALQAGLDEAYPGRVEVINTGVQGWNLMKESEDGSELIPADFTKFIREAAGRYDPDFVIYCICLNDIPTPIHEAFGLDNENNKKRFVLFPERYREWFKRKAFYRVARDSYRDSRFESLDFSFIPLPELNERGWGIVRGEVENLKAACDLIGAELVCILVPFSYQVLPQNSRLNFANVHIQNILDEQGIRWADISSYLTPENVLQYFAAGDYIHLNEKGHRLVAQEARRLIEGDLESLEGRGQDEDVMAVGDMDREAKKGRGN